MGFFSFWSRLPLWIRIPGGLIVSAMGVGLIYVIEGTGRGTRGGTILGILLAFCGMAMMLNGPSDAEKRGYHDI
jgi:hypothetical protein